MTETTALCGARIFDGRRWHDDAAVMVGDGTILGIVPRAELAADAHTETLAGGTLAPGFIDTQVNGGGGLLLNDAPTASAMERIWQAHRRFGTCRMLPTLVTTSRASTDAALQAARAASQGILGLHLEGPYLSPERRGVHDDSAMMAMTDADADRLLSAGVGRLLLLTVAPEQVTPRQVRRLVDGGVVVSLGHSDASHDQAMALINAGASGITHLFNAMSGLRSRAPGLVGAALEAGTVWCGIIADGLHVAVPTLRIALRAKRPPGRLFLVTDAMPTVGSSVGEFMLGSRRIERRGNRLVWIDPDGQEVLAGAHLDMAAAVRFCVSALELPIDEALRMASLYPAQFLRLDDRFGRLAPGYAADIVHLDAGLEVTRTWIAGEATSSA
jgi:N-acetylglucosamine-6-phosphate deacetylase